MSACPTPEKKGRYATRELAARAAASIAFDQRGPNLVPYACPCGMFHLSSGQALPARVRLALHENERESRRRTRDRRRTG